MIGAGRGHLVRTLGDLAAQQGVSSQRYRKLKPYEAAAFPERISSARARRRLYDGEQVDAYAWASRSRSSRSGTTTTTSWTTRSVRPSLVSPPDPGTPTKTTRS
ncbi:hypothetical protein [Streptomyces sp. PvR018]|uniref:hypothetical protein n=1 Tax=Streptomyces sp. PvR018 TaxID=3156442 RepID=UPI00339B1912